MTRSSITKTEQFGRLDIIDRALLRFTNSLFIETQPTSRLIGLAGLIVLVFAVVLAASPTLWLADFFYDVFIPLDGAWRVANGQMPHRDFYTPVGDLYYFMLFIAGKLGGMQPKLVVWNNLLMVPFAVLAMFQASRGRLPASLCAILIASTGLLSMSPRSIDSLGYISFLASYNRHSWALIIPLMVMILVPRGTTKDKWLGDTIAIVFLVLALFYLKATFGIVALPLVFVGLLIPENRKSCAIAAVMILAFFLVFSAISPINRGYLADLARASKVAIAVQKTSSNSMLGVLKIQADLMASWFEWLIPLVLAFWVGRSARNSHERREGDLALFFTLVACGTSLALTWQNHDHSMPTQTAAMVIPVAALWRRFHRRQSSLQSPESNPTVSARPFDLPSGRIGMTLGALFLAYMCGAQIMEDGWAVLNHFYRTAFRTGIPVATLSPTLSQIRLPAGPPSSLLDDVIAGKVPASRYEGEISTSWSNDTATILDDAWRLYKAHEPKSPRVATLYFSSVMSYMTLTPPPRHLPAWLDAARTVGPGAPMDPETTFDDTNVIMIPKIFERKIFLDMISPYLTKNFSFVGETPLWEMWVRRSAIPATEG